MLALVVSCVSTAFGQSNVREPHIGYVYPSGGQRGTTFEILVGGQFLGGVKDVYVSGGGVRATVIQHYRPIGNLDAEQRQELQRRLREAIERRAAELPRPIRAPGLLGELRGGPRRDRNAPTAATTQPVKLPEHPLLRDLDSKSLRELLHIRSEFFNAKKKQPNAQIAESVLIGIAIDADAVPGDREMRLGTPLGLTNPMCFQVGWLPETRELEPNEPDATTMLPPEPPVDLPVLLNGQITPGDVDSFRFRARAGQSLVIDVQARRLIPYLADAVPGWFQATLALYDESGNEVAFDDDYRFDPDPVLLYRTPKAGIYTLEVRDSLYRGREDFVYRVAVAEQPFITRVFPLGGPIGTNTIASIDGWNLPVKRLPLDTSPGEGDIRHTALRRPQQVSNDVSYAVDTLPECDEAEPNDTPQAAQRIEWPQIVNGRIGKPGDADVFRFDGRAGEDVVAEVYARRLQSPVDTLLRLMDASGRVLAWNDDHVDKAAGLCTHHADSYLIARLPADGAYYVQITDSQGQGGDAYGYRLRVGPPRPDFALCVTPSSINVRTGNAVPMSVHVMRKDGFSGDVELALKDAPAGFLLSGARIPAGRDQVQVTLTAPRRPLDEPVVLHVEGRAVINGRTVTHAATPAEDMMQAFLYRHLVASQSLMVAVQGNRAGPAIELVGRGPVRVPAGGTAQVRIRTPMRPALRGVELELRDPPGGVSVQDVTAVPGGLTFTLKADADAPRVGYADNLIVEAFAGAAAQPRDGKGPNPGRRFSLGVLPAIAFEIVPR